MNEQKMPEAIGEKKSKRIINIILFILFVISLLPYLMLAFYSISGVDFFYNTSYGFDAWFFVFIVLSIYIPIFPLTIPYQFIFMAFPFKKLSRALKKASVIAIIVTLIIALLAPAAVEIVELCKITAEHNKDKAIIEAYLIEEYGKENFGDMEIKWPKDLKQAEFEVVSPMLGNISQ